MYVWCFLITTLGMCVWRKQKFCCAPLAAPRKVTRCQFVPSLVVVTWTLRQMASARLPWKVTLCPFVLDKYFIGRYFEPL